METVECTRQELDVLLDRLEVRHGPLDAAWSKYTAMLVPGLVWADQAELDASLKDGTRPPACACVSAHSTLDDLLRVAPCGSCRQRTRFTYVALQKALTRVDHRLQSVTMPTPNDTEHSRAASERNVIATQLSMFVRELQTSAVISPEVKLGPEIDRYLEAANRVFPTVETYNAWIATPALYGGDAVPGEGYDAACRFTTNVLLQMLRAVRQHIDVLRTYNRRFN